MAVAEVLDLQRKSYKIESELIGSEEIPPLKETFEQLQTCGETFTGCFIGSRLAGAVSYKMKEGTIDIHRVMVHPDFFRKGIAVKLLGQIEQKEEGAAALRVSTGAANIPAVRLYEKLSFERQEDSIVSGGLRIANFYKQVE
ncbi:MAG TPA: GNAT family N-acetyltransferase [Bacillus bacterium]|nr:GNAT family N-acetyltransferase [Bacillus sp. (in: firmicutes)]